MAGRFIRWSCRQKAKHHIRMTLARRGQAVGCSAVADRNSGACVLGEDHKGQFVKAINVAGVQLVDTSDSDQRLHFLNERQKI